MDYGRQKFSELLKAIEVGNGHVLESLRKDWSEICHYVETHDQEVRDVKLGDKQAMLILWLSTPPTPEPIHWTDLTGELSFVLDKRQEQIKLVGRLWDSWFNGDIMRQLRTVLGEPEFVDANKWVSNAQAWFETFVKHFSKQSIKDVQQRLDVVAGYGSFVDRLLVAQEVDLADAYVLVLGKKTHPFFGLPDGSHVPVENAAKAIEFRSGLEPGIAKQLAYAISYSLPAHKEILPTIFVELDPAVDCWLRSNWEVPLSIERQEEGASNPKRSSGDPFPLFLGPRIKDRPFGT